MVLMISVKEPSHLKLKDEIINYLKSKGKIQAALLHKLIRRFSKRNSKFKVKKAELISCLILMMKERIIDIIVPNLYDIKWEETELKDLKYLENGNYFIRKFYNLKNEFLSKNRKGKYYFDSRTLDFNDKKLVDVSIDNLKVVINNLPRVKYEIIIFYPQKSKSLIIYEAFKEDFNPSFLDFLVPPRFIKGNNQFKIKLEEQKSDIEIIRSYRNNYMCFYITLIESIHKEIIQFQKQNNSFNDNKSKLSDLIIKFAYYCEIYISSEWVEIYRASPYKWETFFEYFKIPIRILNLEFKSLRFYGRTFESWIRLKYGIFFDKKEQDLILKLKNLGFQEFNEININDEVVIGQDIEIFIPCPSIEHFYFVIKYICYYHLFLLFYHSFLYIRKTNKNFKFTSKDQSLFKIFLPVLESLFNIKNYVSNKLVFKYYTFNPDELEIIYNKFLIRNVRKIEKKIFNYFILKNSLYC